MPRVVARICNPSMLEAEAEDHKLKVRLCYLINLVWKTNINKIKTQTKLPNQKDCQ